MEFQYGMIDPNNNNIIYINSNITLQDCSKNLSGNYPYFAWNKQKGKCYLVGNIDETNFNYKGNDGIPIYTTPNNIKSIIDGLRKDLKKTMDKLEKNGDKEIYYLDKIINTTTQKIRNMQSSSGYNYWQLFIILLIILSTLYLLTFTL